MKKYKLIISALFKEDLADVAYYIAKIKMNPQSAKNLVLKTNKAIRNRLLMPTAAEAYSPENSNKIYYRIYVGNYIVYYSVTNDVMEVKRFLHGSRDIGRLL